MTGVEGLDLAERSFYAACIGASGAVIVSVVGFGLDLPLLATLGSPEVTLLILSTLFGVPAFWYLSRRPNATVSRSVVHAALAGLFGLVVGMLALIALLVAGTSLPWGTAGWAGFVAGVAAVVGGLAYVLIMAWRVRVNMSAISPRRGHGSGVSGGTGSGLRVRRSEYRSKAPVPESWRVSRGVRPTVRRLPRSDGPLSGRRSRR